MASGEDDREAPETVRTLILARRRRFIAAAVAGIGMTGGAGCDAFAAPPSDDPFAVGGSMAPQGFPPQGGFDAFGMQPIAAGESPPIAPSTGDPQACDRDGDRDAGADDDAGMAEPCVCLSLTLAAEDGPEGAS